MRIIHLSDVHVWRYSYNPFHLLNKRAVGIASLLAGRAKKFRLERLSAVVDRVRSLDADHLLITGDLTTTALAAEFDDAREALAVLLADPSRATVIPGNHDRYTVGSVRSRKYEATFGQFAPSENFPWLRRLDAETAILGLDPTRSHLSARGLLPATQLAMARDILANPITRPKRLIVACHYPVVAPSSYAAELAPKRMKNAPEVADWLSTIGPHLFCCGHVHAAWAFVPASLPNQLCLNSGAPLLRDPTGGRPPGFLEIEIHDRGVSVLHHAWMKEAWEVKPMFQNPAFFPHRRPRAIARLNRITIRFRSHQGSINLTGTIGRRLPSIGPAGRCLSDPSPRAALSREPAPMSRREETSRDLLFGLLALQNGLIDQDQLVAAFRAWSRSDRLAMAEVLVDLNALEPDQSSALDLMVNLHLKKNGGNAEKSLAALGAGHSTREKLAAIADPDLDASLAVVGPAVSPVDDPDRTVNEDVGEATSDGRRFRVLRPLARGARGAVFVALDLELNREVAIKQILDDADDYDQRARFLVEAEITGSLETSKYRPGLWSGLFRGWPALLRDAVHQGG